MLKLILKNNIMKKLLLLILLLLSIATYSKDDNKYNYNDDEDDNDHDEDCDDEDDFPPTAPINDYVNLLLVLGCVYAFKTSFKK